MNDEVSDFRDGMPKLDPTDPVLIAAHTAAVETGEDEEHVSNASVDGADGPLLNHRRDAITSSLTMTKNKNKTTDRRPDRALVLFEELLFIT